jgi:hypothetical protein
MKVIISAVVLTLILITTQAMITKSTSDTETLDYTVVKAYDNFEIREYPTALFTSVEMSSTSYKESSSQGFNALAGYIFGGNSTNEKIAMTSPVIMEMDSSMVMRFKVPEAYSQEDLPEPNNKEISFTENMGGTYAAIQFGGWASDEKIEEYATILRTQLKENSFLFENKVIFMGYNPPYQLTNRRNEVLFKLND